MLLPLLYAAPVAYYQLYFQTENVLLEQHENFIKASFRNRCNILGPNGVMSLSIPLEMGRNQHNLYKDIRVDTSQNWQKKHWQSIKTAYGSAPFFVYFAPELATTYGKNYTFLWDFNYELHQNILSFVGKNSSSETFTQTYRTDVESSDFRAAFYTQSRKCMPYSPTFTQTYAQVFGYKYGFVPNLSILDLLMNYGKRTATFF
ncbi:MAG: WbqC family protein [Chitinophagales bacterium]|nr:WbqC family protein [Bacteroidota bacterium]